MKRRNEELTRSLTLLRIKNNDEKVVEIYSDIMLMSREKNYLPPPNLIGPLNKRHVFKQIGRQARDQPHSPRAMFI